MNAHDAVAPVESGLKTDNPTALRWSGRRLVVARVLWLVIVGLCFGLFLLGLPPYADQLRMVCTIQPASACPTGALSPAGIQALHAMGVSIKDYIWYAVTIEVLNVLVWASVGIVLFWRRSDEWMAWLTALVLVINNPISFGQPAYPILQYSPLLAGLLAVLSFLAQVLFVLFFMLFPNGRVAPRWVSWAIVPVIVEEGARLFAPSNSVLNANNWPGWLISFIAVMISGAVIYSQIYRYRRVLTPTERQQTKVVLLGIVSVLVGGLALSWVVHPFLVPPGLYEVINVSLWSLLNLAIPMSLGLAMLRYRLWDIDLIIRQTLVYGALTTILAIVYGAGVIGTQALINTLARNPGAAPSPPLVVVTTVVIVTLFRPLRRRLQTVIDRRFYRSKYDAAKTLEVFSARLRAEVDLDDLQVLLVRVVGETVQPEHISLWLRQPKGEQWARQNFDHIS
jgi:hypothetical protein